ncbi:MAG: PD-(D/E)XK nuclease family protein [Vampirovibrionales bacterium]
MSNAQPTTTNLRLFYVALTRAKQTLRVLVPASTVGDEKAWHTPEALYRLNEVTIYNEWEDLSHFEALCVLANASLQTAQQRTKHSHKHLQGESDPQETVATVHPAQTVASALPTHGDPWLQRRGQKPWNLSYSNMQRWQRCPTLFYFQDVLRLPTPVSLNPRPSSPQEYRNHLANLRGVAIHTCLEQYYLTQGEAEAWPRQRDRLAQQFQQQWQQTSLGQTALTLQEATDLWQQVATALQAFEATPYNISTLQQEAVTWLAPEQRLTLPLPLSLMLGSESVPQPVQLTATLDALFFYPSTGVLQVVDFKVQEAISPQQHHAHHQQLALYAAALPALLPPTSGVRQLQLNTVQYQHQRQAWVCHTHDTRCLEANTFTGVAVAQQQVLPLVKPFIDALQTLLQQPADAIPTPWPATTPPCATCRYASVCPHGGR